MRAARSWVAAFVLFLARPCPSDAQSTPALSGRYRFILTPSPSCPSSVRVGALTVLLDVRESPAGARAEVAGQGAAPSAIPDNGRFVFLRESGRVHGAFGASTVELGLDTDGPYRLWMQIMADGAVTTAANGRARATGTAFGEVELSLSTDPTGNPTGNCQATTPTHQWTLEPV